MTNEDGLPTMSDDYFDTWLAALEAVDGSKENAVRNYVAGLRRTATELAERSARTAAALEDARNRGAQIEAELREARDAVLDMSRESARLRAMIGKGKP